MDPVTLQIVMLVLGVALVGLIVWVEYKFDDSGCLPIIIGALALTLILGGIAGPQAATSFWGH